MGKGREIHCFDYVNHRYAEVHEALTTNAGAVFRLATKAAASRAHSVASALRAEISGIAVETDINISVRNIEEVGPGASSPPMTRLSIEWEAAVTPRLFPLMKAELSIYPLTGTETQLDFLGTYEPPLGALGKALNAIAGHKIAEASVHRFVGDIASYLRRTLP